MNPPRAFRRVGTATVVMAVVVLAAATLGTPAAAGPHSPDTHQGRAATQLQHYAVNKPLCTQPADASAFRCFAWRRVDVDKRTRGAYAYVRPQATYRGPAGGYTPRALAKAYDFNPWLHRSGHTIAVVLWHDNPRALHDLNVFDRHYGLPQETTRSFRKVNQRGKSAPLPGADPGAAGEISLDLQTIRAVCHTCRLLLVEADTPTDTAIAAAENTAARLGATEINNSFGAPERRVSTKIRDAFTHPGVVVTASTGDDGWYGWDWSNYAGAHSDGAPSFPASLRSVVSVGGTTLTLTAHGNRAHETVWNANGAHDAVGRARHAAMGASSGGCSRHFPALAIQTHGTHYRAAGCHGKRLSADVSAVGDPQTGFDVYDGYGYGGWVTVGGTSLSSPLVAAMYALAGGAAHSYYPATAVYVNASVHPGTRYDVRSGGTGYCHTDSAAACGAAVSNRFILGGTHNPNGLPRGVKDCSFARSGADVVPAHRSVECTAAGGYDGPSGVGTPASLGLFRPTVAALSITRSGVARAHRSQTFRLHVHQRVRHTHMTRFTWRWGDGTGGTTRRSRLHHHYSHAGKYVITLTGYDNRHQVVRVHKHVTIGG